MLRAGDLRHRIEIHAMTSVSDGGGGWTQTWAKITGGDAWARVWMLGGEEKLQAMQLNPAIHGKVWMRGEWGDTITAQHRIVFDGKAYEVVSAPTQDLRDERIEFFIREVA